MVQPFLVVSFVKLYCLSASVVLCPWTHISRSRPFLFLLQVEVRDKLKEGIPDLIVEALVMGLITKVATNGLLNCRGDMCRLGG